MKKISLLLVAMSLTGCLKIQVKSPDNLVKDTVDASKDAYQSVSDKINGNKESTFSHQYFLVSNEEESAANGQCIEQVKLIAAQSLGTEKFDVRETKTSSGESNEQAYVNCKIIVVSK
ncbi:hypothetical protein A9Q99_11495 [Gammaproteobacteria bacterium 45_16_T64]|nr:hypothetical protein A9Q99_11495 [Gammaproteobacteria bacterium 45_16_T64]